jgi:anti-sigma factor RsiW
MPTATQLPGSLSLAFRAGDEYGTVIDFDTSLSGYTVSSAIVSLVTGQTVATATTTFVDAAAGSVNVALTEAQTASLAPGTYGWRLEWDNGAKRTALQGFAEVTR